MKKVMLSVAVIAMVLFVSCKSESNKESGKVKTETLEKKDVSNVSFGVRGNCGMCKKTIEKSLNGILGVSSANWNVKSKIIDVSYDKSKIDEKGIHSAIAASGYDTEKVMGNIDAYNNLPGCCKYDHAMLINESGKTEIEDHSNHTH